VLDAISVLVGTHAAKESDARPVLVSDIAFEATLILVARFGPQGVNRRITKAVWLEALRRATLIRLLAGQARHLHEAVAPEEKQQIRKEIIAGIGGERVMAQCLKRLGLSRDALNTWIENAALALTQIGYAEDQVELSDAEFTSTAAEATDGPGAAPTAVREKYREMIMEEKRDEQIRKWLVDISKKGSIRVIR
jgi:hypothetical protein